MKRQIQMEESMRLAHRQFIANLENGLNFLEEELKEADELADVCTDEWCKYTEDLFDDLHKEIYAISEPRWLKEEDSAQLKHLRTRVKNLYTHFLSTRSH